MKLLLSPCQKLQGAKNLYKTDFEETLLCLHMFFLTSSRDKKMQVTSQKLAKRRECYKVSYLTNSHKE